MRSENKILKTTIKRLVKLVYSISLKLCFGTNYQKGLQDLILILMLFYHFFKVAHENNNDNNYNNNNNNNIH